VNLIKDYGLGEVIGKGRSGYGQYSLVKFNLEKLAEYDLVGVSKYCRKWDRAGRKTGKKANGTEAVTARTGSKKCSRKTESK